jgi:hypothetical protein
MVVAWRAATPAGTVVRARRYSAADSRWSAAVDAPAPSAQNLLVETDAGGDVVLAWSQLEAIALDGCKDTEIRIAIYSASTDTWRGPMLVKTFTGICASRTFGRLASWRMAIDLPRGVFFTWTEEVVVVSPGYFVTYYPGVARYAIETGMVEEIGLGSESCFHAECQPTADVAADPFGRATTLLTRPGQVSARRYVPSAGAWSTPVALATEEGRAVSPRLGADAAGNVTAIWCRFPIDSNDVLIRAARYDASSDTWGSVATLAFNRGSGCPELSVAPSGNALAVWGSRDDRNNLTRIQAALYAAGSWETARDLTPGDGNAGSPNSASDELGNTTAIWWQQAAGGALIRAARIAAGGVVTPHDIAALDQPTADLAVATANGLVAVTWTHGTGSSASVEIAIWRWTPDAPTVTGVDPSPGAVTVHFTAPAGTPALALSNYAYSLDDGATWTPRDPPSTASPLVVSGMTDSLAYPLRIRGINDAGPGASTVHLLVRSGGGPNGPTGLEVTGVAGDTVTVAWTPPSAGLVPLGYLLEGGVNPGDVLASIPTWGTAPTFTFTAPSGAFYIRLHAVAGALRSPASNEIRIVVNIPAAPSAPTNLLGLVDGGRVALSWINTFEGGPPTSLWLQVSGSVRTALPLPLGEVFTFAPVPQGTYTLSVVAANAAGVSAPSNAVTLTFPNACTDAPGRPVNFQAWKSGSTIGVSWKPAPSGPAVTSYSVIVGGAYTGRFSTGERTLSGTAAPGTYTLSVVATNPCGTSEPAPAQVIVIP